MFVKKQLTKNSVIGVTLAIIWSNENIKHGYKNYNYYLVALS